MNIGQIYKNIKKKIEDKHDNNRVAKEHKAHFTLMQKNGVKFQHLNAEQKKAVDEIYSRYKCNYSYSMHELYLSATGEFEPTIVPEDFFRVYINETMNRVGTLGLAWADKNYYEIFHSQMPLPETILRYIRGKFLDKDYNLITKEEADKILAEAGEYFIKPSLEGGGFGHGVALIKKHESIDAIIKKYQFDVTIQKKFIQHKDMAQLNESSVNVVRIMTMFIDEKPEFLLAAVRAGESGAITDHSNTKGKGSAIFGLNEDGTAMDYGFNACGVKVTECSNGFKFGGVKIPSFEELKSLALKSHEKMPMFKLIAWDMVVAEDGAATVMEYNIKRPGIILYQWTNGPLFGKDINRLHYVLKKLNEA